MRLETTRNLVNASLSFLRGPCHITNYFDSLDQILDGDLERLYIYRMSYLARLVILAILPPIAKPQINFEALVVSMKRSKLLAVIWNAWSRKNTLEQNHTRA